MTGAVTLDPTILREYDIRGVVGDTLTEAAVEAVGRAYGTRLIREGGRRAAVGYDGRLSSPALEARLVAGLAAAGVDVLRIGRGPTPMLYFAAHHLKTDGGLTITGSHNPPDYNGIKMTLLGRPFFGDDIRGLGAIAAAGDFEQGAGRVEDASVLDAYVDRLLRDFVPGRDLTVAWDPGNGAAAQVLPALCARLPGRHIIINGEVDGTFPAHHPDPTVEENLEQLKDTVAREACDLGFAFDGDGDRIGVIDARGRVLWGDQLLLILAREVLADEPGATIIADVKTSQAFFDEIARLGGEPVMACTGHSPIKTLMAERGAPLAGEMSGHIFFKHRYYGFDDALYAAVRLLAIAGTAELSLAQMRDAMPALVNTPELRIDCAEERKFGVITEVRERVCAMRDVKVTTIDGVRVTSEGGWWLLRASNTQPVLVGRCEAADAAGLARQIAHLEAQLRASGIEPPPITATQ